MPFEIRNIELARSRKKCIIDNNVEVNTLLKTTKGFNY